MLGEGLGEKRKKASPAEARRRQRVGTREAVPEEKSPEGGAAVRSFDASTATSGTQVAGYRVLQRQAIISSQSDLAGNSHSACRFIPPAAANAGLLPDTASVRGYAHDVGDASVQRSMQQLSADAIESALPIASMLTRVFDSGPGSNSSSD